MGILIFKDFLWQ